MDDDRELGLRELGFGDAPPQAQGMDASPEAIAHPSLTSPPESTLPMASPSVNPPPRKLGEPFLRCALAPQCAALIPMRSVQEVMLLPVSRLTAMPNMPSCLLGLMNRSNRVFWLLDVGQILGTTRLDGSSTHYDVVIIQHKGTWLGLAVHQVNNMVWLDPRQIQAIPSYMTPPFVHLLEGCWIQDHQAAWVLAIAQILEAPVLRNWQQDAVVP